MPHTLNDEQDMDVVLAAEIALHEFIDGPECARYIARQPGELCEMDGTRFFFQGF